MLLNRIHERTAPRSDVRASMWRRVIIAAITVICMAVLGTLLRGPDNSTTGDGARDGVVTVASRAPIVRANCPDARASAERAAQLALLVARPEVRLDLSPRAGCAAAGTSLEQYRASVRHAALRVSFPPGAWTRAGSLRAELTRALVKGLGHTYPRARIDVAVFSAGKVTARASSTP